MDTGLFTDFLPGYEYRRHLISTLTRVDGRGVNSGNRNIQTIRENDPERTSTTLMHELGHAHGFMGDEYRSSDDRDSVKLQRVFLAPPNFDLLVILLSLGVNGR